MIINADRTALAEAVSADIVIVGAGPAGIVLALELARASIDVVLLEAGGQRFSRSSQDHYRAQSVSPESHGPVDMFRRRVLGGSTSVWGGRCIPFDRLDFEKRSWMRYSGWPVEFDDVAQYYPDALAYSQAGAAVFDAEHAFSDRGSAMIDGVESSNVILDRIERFSEPTDFGRRYFSDLKDHPRIRVYLNTPVTELLTTAQGHAAQGAAVTLRSGKRVDFLAPTIVLAAGGLETARLLLSSSCKTPKGLGNSKDLVGRFYQCHIEGEIGTLAIHNGGAARIDYNRTIDGIYARRYIWLSPAAQRSAHLAGLVLRPSHPNIVDPDHKNAVLSAMFLVKNLIVPEYARKLTSLEDVERQAVGTNLSLYRRHIQNIIFGLPQLLPFASQWTRHRILARRKLPSVVLNDPRSLYPVDINAEQEPNPDSRVTLGEERDALGMRRLQIDWQTTPADHDRLASGLRLMQSVFNQSGVADLVFDDESFDRLVRRKIPVGGHHIGTARMADTAKSGVCDRNCELFETRGIFIAGAAAFTTSSFANPTLTVLAMTLRLAAYLRGRIRTGDVD